MLRIKIPMGLLDASKMYKLADLSEEYADGVSHITTRQDIQYHFVDINDTPNLMRRLAEVGITTKEACGNTVRNVVACPMVGLDPQQAFDRSRFVPEESIGQKGLAPEELEAWLHATLGFVGVEDCPFIELLGSRLVAKTRPLPNQIFLATAFSSRSILKWHFQSTRFTGVWGAGFPLFASRLMAVTP